MKWKLFILAFILPFCANAQDTLNKVEFWFDDDFAGRKIVNISDTQYTFDSLVSTNGLSTGMHFFNCRFGQKNLYYSSVVTKMFIKLPATNDTGYRRITAYEYWFDTAYGARVSDTLAADSNVHFIADLNPVVSTPGLHTLNIRFKDNSNVWSSVISKMFVKLSATTDTGYRRITAYEYWFDSAYAARITDTVAADSSLHFITDIKRGSVSNGLHTLNIRFKDNGNVWSTTLSKFVLINQGGSTGLNTNVVTAMRYWIDTFVSKMDTVLLNTPAEQAFVLEQINLSNYDTGDHYIYMQFKDAANYWSSAIVDSFYQIGRPRIDSYTPKVGGNTGDVTMTIYGSGYIKGTSVKLTRTGYADIVVPDSMVVIHQGRLIKATFDLRGKDTGLYNLVVTVPNDTVMVISNGFRIEAGGKDIWVKIIGPSGIRPSTWQEYILSYGNNGNINGTGVPIYLAISKSCEVDFKNLFILFQGDSVIEAIDSPYLTVEVDTLFGESHEYKVYCLILANLPAKSSGSISFRVKTNSQIKIRTWTSMTFYSSPLALDVITCVEDVIAAALNKNPLAGCIYSVFRERLDPIIKLAVEGDMDKYEFGFSQAKLEGLPAFITDLGVGVAKSYIKCMGLSGDPISGAKATLKKMLSWGNVGKSCGKMLKRLYEDYVDVPLIASYDPNAKYGPQGHGINNFTTTTAFPYLITYENDKTATAWAQTVRIVDTLDTTVIDKSSFELGFVQLADSIINIPNGKKQHKMYIDMRPHGNDVIVQLDAGVNDTTGIATWLYQTLDPATMLPTTNPLAGFVPPNVNAPEGEGGVFFTVKLKDGVVNNTVVSNKAYIYFDNNAPIATEAWKNTIDNIKPHSNVNPLPTFVADTVINVSWNGTDTSSGVMYYTVYVSENGKPYEVWRYKVGYTADTFIGKTDSTYAFFSVATDTAGNVEAMPGNYDAITKLVPVSVTSLDKENGNIALYPNPTDGTFTVEGKVETDKPLTISVYNVLGQKVLSESVSVNNSSFKRRLNIKSQPPGQYSVVINADDWSKVYKLSKL